MSLLTKQGDNEKYSNEELFNILFYGGLAHQNKEYINEFMVLTKQGAFSAFVFGFFLSSLSTILNVVRNIRELNITLIEILKDKQHIEADSQ